MQPKTGCQQGQQPREVLKLCTLGSPVVPLVYMMVHRSPPWGGTADAGFARPCEFASMFSGNFGLIISLTQASPKQISTPLFRNRLSTNQKALPSRWQAKVASAGAVSESELTSALNSADV
jgi:hypothetical protein